MRKARKGKTKMSEELLQKLIDLVTNVAPQLWEIGVRQALVEGGKSILISVICLLVLFVCTKMGMDVLADKEYVDDETGVLALVLFAVALLCLIIGGSEFFQGISYLLNPQYYAIEILLDLVK